MRLGRRLATVGAGGLAMVVLAAGPAFAHECFNASRSDQGNTAAAAHSKAWAPVSLHTILTVFIGVDADVAACVEEHADEFGIPSSFVFGDKQAQGQGGVIAENNPNMSAKGLSSNGKGIDHAEDAYGPALGAAIGFCSAP